jgi:DNA invertase Pin-like site-specific DNA recombinase
VRMSTEHQQYSIENQSAAIALYAAAHNLGIMRSFVDPGKTGMTIRRRKGLQDLIQTVEAGEADFTDILVYDVSRWGRFPDTDESAYYEYLCKRAGVRVQYCAELFENDNSPTSNLLKALKRTMASEYSRELSVKVSAGQRLLASMGFWQGGYAPFGMMRQLVDHEKKPKGLLKDREWKSISTDRCHHLPGDHADRHRVSVHDDPDCRTESCEGASSLTIKTSPGDNYSDSVSAQLNREIGFPANSGTTRANVFIHVAGAGDSAINTDNSVASLNEWNLRNTFGLQARNHLLKFGIDERHIASTNNPASLSIQADFFTRDSMLSGIASDIAITQSAPANPILNQFSAFAQDEWRASRALTLSLGLRWEVNPPPKGSDGMNAYTAIGDVVSPSTLKLAPRGTPLWHTGWFNFAPRFGAAWMLDSRPDREMVVRAGAGVFFDTGDRPALQAFTAAGFSTTKYFSNAPLPVTAAQVDFSSVPASPSVSANTFAFPAHLQLPYSIQWDIALEKALGRNQAFTISYVGAHGARLLQEQRRNVNPINPNFGDVTFFPGGLTSNYQSLQAKFQRSISHGVQALASYTWAHALDYGSTDPAYPLTYGNSDLDVRHNLEAALSWDLPRPGRNIWLRYFFGSWGVDGRLIARTAYPVTLLANLFSDPVTGARYYNGVDFKPNRPLYQQGSEYPGGRIINGGPNATNPAFVLPDGVAAGDAPRNIVRGFDAVQANVAIRREMPIFDRLTVQLRAETFNVLNHPNFGYIDPSLSDTLFGQSTKMLNQSFGPTGSLYQQGGPRSIQFSFKAIF